MSSLEQLAISGIRSFNPDTSCRQIIAFQKPVTIILGPNGAGKTTIIEALRNACTGEVPSYSGKGAAFIHDPQVAGETEVKGQIRLQFRSAEGQQMLIGRSYQLTQTSSSKQKFETLDVSLQTRNKATGEVVSQSYKCTDIDQLIPDIMGITKPILDSVIFLHQDDANWPLADPGTVKKKFDDIFSSTRYTKALEEIRKVQKENKMKLREHATNLAVFKEKRQVAHQLRGQVEEEQQKANNLTLSIKDLEDKVQNIERRIADASKYADEVQLMESNAIRLQGHIEALTAQRDTMGDALQVVSDEPDDKLEQALQQYDQLIEEQRQATIVCERQLKSTLDELHKEEEAISKLQGQKQYLAAQGENHQRRVQQLQGILHRVAQLYQLRSPGHVGEGGLDDKAVLAFYKEFQDKVQEIKGKRDNVRVQSRKAQEAIEKELTTARQKRDRAEADMKAIESRSEALKPTIRDLKDKYNRLSTAEAERDAARQQLAEAEDRQRVVAQEAESMNSHLATLSAKYKGLQEQAEALRMESKSRRDEQEAAHKLRLLREEREGYIKEAAEIRSRIDGRFAQMVGKKLVASTLFEDVAAALKNKKNAVERALHQYQAADKEGALLQQEIDQLTKRHEAVSSEIEMKQSKYKDLTVEYGMPLPDLLTKAEAREEKDRKAVSTMQALKLCHDTFRQQAAEEKCCPVCDRGMTEGELGAMQRHLKGKLQDVPISIAKKEEALQQTKTLLRQVRDLMPLHYDVAKLSDEVLPNIVARQAELRGKLSQHNEVLKDHSARLEALRFEERECQDLMFAAEKIKDLNKQATAGQQRISDEERKIMTQHGHGVRPLDVVQSELDAVQSQLNEVAMLQQKEMAAADEKRSVQAELMAEVQRRRRAVDERQVMVEERGRVRQQYETTVDEYKKGNVRVQELKSQLPGLEQQVQRLMSELKQQQEASDRREAELTSNVEQHQQDLSNIESHIADIQRYVEEKHAEQLEAVLGKIVKISDRQRDRHDKIAHLEARLGELQRKLNQQDVMRRELQANVEYRAKRREVEQVSAELSRVKATIKEKTQGQQAIWESLDKLREEKGRIERERAMLLGQLQATQAQIQSKQVDLQSPKYERIDERYNSTMIRLATSQMMEEDLTKYAYALDAALMKYHDEKISEMNEIIKDLWIRTYRGQDIDYIELRSDVEQPTARSRNYHYRVVMVKGGTALDMRGRCSAGQRVLASLVVRLALSQAFCCDCGILALDEPTTNLDHENIDSLAHALVEIIQSRKGESNFQLIVITHDEQFVRLIGQAVGTEHIFYVNKDGEGSYSQIAKRRLAEMM